MQDSVILAAAEGMPKLDRAAIMSHAWKLYRRDWANARPAKLKPVARPSHAALNPHG